MAVNREEQLVELVDAHGRAIGMCSVAEAHTLPGRHHRAYSVLLVDAGGSVLLQQRAAVKTRFPLRWSNTCCGHPAPGRPVGSSAARRLGEEMGLSEVPFTEVGAFNYRAQDPATGRVEDEHDHVLLGRVGPDRPVPDPDPAEVADWRWVPAAELRSELIARPDQFTPWLSDVLRLATASASAAT
jgi:isopentenyl-diphosphate delta-isomerase